MWTARRFRLKEQILVTELQGGDRVAHYIPRGELVVVAGGPRTDDIRLVDLFWGDRTVTVFAVDLEARGEEVSAETA